MSYSAGFTLPEHTPQIHALQVFFERVLVNPAVDEDGRVVLPEDGTNDDGDGNDLPDAVDSASDMTRDGGAANGALDPDPAARVADTAADGNRLMGEDDGPVLRSTTLRLLANASSNATVAADLRLPFACLTSRLMHNVARQHRATLLQDNTQENRDSQLDCPINNIVCNDEALTSGGERFASSSTNPDRVTHDLGLGKAIVVREKGLEPSRPKAPGPKPGASTNSATRAARCPLYRPQSRMAECGDRSCAL